MTDKNNEKSQFGDNFYSSSIFFEDLELNNSLSSIIKEQTPEGQKDEVLKKLTEKNELDSAYQKAKNLKNEDLKNQFNEDNIKSSEIQLKSNIVLNTDKKEEQQSSESKEDNDDDLFLKIEDFPTNPICETFLYSEAVDSIRNLIPMYKKDLDNIDLKQLSELNIYIGKGVEAMVEQTYQYDKFLKQQMTEEICYLKRTMTSWRRVAGDGNCFYRSVIFGWLEYLVFNKKTTILKIILTNLYVKFDPSYKKTKILPPHIKNAFVTNERFLAMTILEIIIRYLEKNEIKEAYLTLLKAFNIRRAFDRTMIYYLRFLIYEYISDNQSKLFKKDFPVLLGNLLPQEYETNDGKFLYDDYFQKDLLKYYTCAEKLAVYLVPFILKINLNIVFYYFGEECDIENKFFSCELPDKDRKKDTINVLYRKAHYDVCYTKDFYNDFNILLDIYTDLKMQKGIDYHIVNKEDIQKENNTLNQINPYDPEKSVIFNRVLFQKNLKQKKEQQKIEKIEGVGGVEKIEKKIEKNENLDDKKIDTKDFIIKEISNKHLSEICFICKNEFGNEKNSEILPCKCTITFCSDKCKQKYYKEFVSFINSMNINISFKCGRCSNEINRTSLIKNCNLDNTDIKNALKNKMMQFFDKYCMNCLSHIDTGSKFKIEKCKWPQLLKLLDKEKFMHKKCKNCLSSTPSICKICDMYHKRLVDTVI